MVCDVVAASAFPIFLSPFLLDPSPLEEADDDRGEGGTGEPPERYLARRRARGEERVFASSPFCCFAGRGAMADEEGVDTAGLAGVGRYWGVASFFEESGGGTVVVEASARPYLPCSAENAAA